MNVEKWQEKWDKLFERVRLRWITTLSPKAFEFMKDIKVLYGEQYGGKYVLYFKSINRKHRIELEDISRATPNIGIIRGFDFAILNNYTSNTRFYPKHPFEEKDASPIMEFLKDVKNELVEMVVELNREKQEKDNQKTEDMLVGLTIVSVDKKKRTGTLSNGTIIPLHSAFLDVEEASTNDILNGLE